MKSSYTLKTGNKAQTIWISVCTFLRLYILSFIKQNASVFESLTRSATPFGGSVLTGNR